MPRPYRSRERQVSLTVFDNEPLARLAEQRLRQANIPCLTRSLQGGPGLWGSAYNLPHAVYVYESDEMRAREVLGLMPLEVVERERAASEAGRQPRAWLIGLIIVIILTLILTVPALATMFR
jgi:putative signal transducing protein